MRLRDSYRDFHVDKIDRIADRSNLHILMAHHPTAVAISGATGEGIDRLRDAVIEALTADFIEADILAGAGNGKVLAYLNAHAEIYRQQYQDSQVVVRCHIPKHLLKKYIRDVKTGLPGVAYVQLDPQAPWPAHLEVNVPQ